MCRVTKFASIFFLSALLLACAFGGGTPTAEPSPVISAEAAFADTNTPPPPTDTVEPEPPDNALEVETCPPAELPVSGWPIYCNEHYKFYVQYPAEAVFEETDFNTARIDLPVVPDTNLGEKYVEIIVQESSAACTSGLTEGYQPESYDSENMVINGTNFLKQSGSDAGAGNIWQWIAYTTGKTNLCVSFNFVLHSTNPYNYPTPPPEFDFEAETAVFEQIIETFHWYER